MCCCAKVVDENIVEKKFVYKLRNKVTGLYSMGGQHPWNKNGKIWKSAQDLKRHFTMISDKIHHDMSEWEVVPFEIVEKRPCEVAVFRCVL